MMLVLSPDSLFTKDFSLKLIQKGFIRFYQPLAPFLVNVSITQMIMFQLSTPLFYLFVGLNLKVCFRISRRAHLFLTPASWLCLSHNIDPSKITFLQELTRCWFWHQLIFTQDFPLNKRIHSFLALGSFSSQVNNRHLYIQMIMFQLQSFVLPFCWSRPKTLLWSFQRNSFISNTSCLALEK